MKYIYVEQFKDGHQFRQAFNNKAEAIGFANMHFERNPDIKRACVVETEEEDPNLKEWINGHEIKVLTDN